MTLVNTAIALSIITAGTQVFTAVKGAQQAKKRGKKVEELETKRIAEEGRLKKQSAGRRQKRRGVTTGKIPTRRDIRTSAIGLAPSLAGGKALIGA